MSAPRTLQFRHTVTPPGNANKNGQISLDEISDMTIAEFMAFEGRLLNVRRRKRRDVAVNITNVAIAANTVKEIFRVGAGGNDSLMNQPATVYKKTRWHTNMPRGGDFGSGNIAIITSMEAFIATFALKGTTYTDGAVTNPLGVAALANYDPALLHHTLVKMFEIGLWRGEQKIVDGLAEEFDQTDLITGTAGAAVGAIFQNGGVNNGKLLENPQVLVDNEDFFVRVEALHALDTTAATGLNVPVNVQVKLNTIELTRVYE